MKQPATYLQKDEVAEYTVYYPSGQTFCVEGVFGMIVQRRGGWTAPYVKSKDGDVFILHPCAVVSRRGGVVYEPRGFSHLFPAETVEWLATNPTWPARVTAVV